LLRNIQIPPNNRASWRIVFCERGCRNATLSAAPLGDASRGPDSPERVSAEVVTDWHRRYFQELDAFLRGVLRDRELAAEALQNTFQRALESGHAAQPATVRGWLFKVAFHEAMRLRRRQAVQERSLQKFSQDWLRSRDGTADHVAGALVREEDIQQVRLALESLPPEQRVIVERRIYREETFATIAAELRLPLGTVLSRMRAAMEKLQRRLRLPES
jgi:RNA polymerase sigma-70 factor (ECF subfamily)